MNYLVVMRDDSEQLLRDMHSDRRRSATKAVADLMRTSYPWQETYLLTEFTCARLHVSGAPAFAAFPPDDAVELLGGATLNHSGYMPEPTGPL